MDLNEGNRDGEIKKSVMMGFSRNYEIMMGFFTKHPDVRTKPWNPCILYY
jgi:hypothetical protein